MIRPSDSLRLLPVVSSLVRNLPLNSAASSAIHIDGFRPSSARSSAGRPVMRQSSVLRSMRSHRTVTSGRACRRIIVRAVSKQIAACSSLFATTWTRRPSPSRRSHSATPAASVVLPLPRATCRIASFVRRLPSAAYRQPHRLATTHVCHGCSSNWRPESSPTSVSRVKCSSIAATDFQSISRSERCISKRHRRIAAYIQRPATVRPLSTDATYSSTFSATSIGVTEIAYTSREIAADRLRIVREFFLLAKGHHRASKTRFFTPPPTLVFEPITRFFMGARPTRTKPYA